MAARSMTVAATPRATASSGAALAVTLLSFRPLGSEYVETLRKGYADRWFDFMPNAGKSPGAYSNTVYGVHPYQLLNFNGAWDDVSTLAHESGHSMHSFLSSAQQPYATASYSTFVAEVASTLNENLPQFVSIGTREYWNLRDGHYLGPAHDAVPLRIDPANPLDFGRPGGFVSPRTASSLPPGSGLWRPAWGPPLARKASCGMSTEPTDFMRFLPSFCFSSSLRLREMSPP